LHIHQLFNNDIHVCVLYQLLEQIEEYLCYSGNIPKLATMHTGIASIGEEEEDKRPYFHFVDFPNLKNIVKKAQREELFASEELAKKISISKFIMALKRAIDAGNWFDGDNRCITSPANSNDLMNRACAIY
jgi:hypothetical protein